MVCMTELGFVKMKNWVPVTPSLYAKSDECDGVTRRRVTPSPRKTELFRGLDTGQRPKKPCNHLVPDLRKK